jgi:peroxiredoxin
VGVAWTGTDAEFQEFIDRHGLTFPQISDDAADVYRRFDVAAQPALAIIRPDGEVETLFGAADGELLDSLIQRALDS